MLRRLLIRYEWLIIMGLLITIWSFLNVFGYTNTDSDLFWALAGLGLVVEGFIELYYEKKGEK